MVAETAATHINMHGLMHTLSPSLIISSTSCLHPPPHPKQKRKKREKYAFDRLKYL